MIDYTLDYLASMDVYAADEEEQKALETGIKLWLLENGIRETDSDDYRKKYIVDALNKISTSDLKTFLISYPVISEVVQIVFEYKEDGSITADRKNELMGYMKKLYESGIGDKYLPVSEIRSILG